MKIAALLVATAATVVSVPAFAQSWDKSQDFNGGYISIVGGKSLQPNDRGEMQLFDYDGEGNFEDITPDLSEANGDKPPFCNGRAPAEPGAGCRNDKDGAEYYARLGMDKRSGNFVIGALVEVGRNESIDYVTAMEGDDYVQMSRQAQWNAGARLRAGYTPGGGALFYVTGGGAYARMKNGFETSMDVGPIRDTGKSNAWGWSAGGGGEVMLAKNLSFGLEYLYTDLKDDNYVVAVGFGSEVNPTALAGGGSGTFVKRSSPNIRNHSVRGSLSLRF